REQLVVDAGAIHRGDPHLRLLSPNPLTYFHHVEPAIALPFCRRHNDALAALVARHPTRLGALAALPMQDIGAAIEELERACGELGMYGACIGTDLGVALDSAEMDRFYARVAELDVPLFFHPAPAGIDGPPADPRLQRFELDIMFGFNIQETLAVITLVVGGVLQRHPGLDICMSHGGGTIAFVAGRLSQATRKRAWSPDFLRQDGAFEESLRKIWYDTHVHDHRSLALLIEVVGTDRLVMGTNFAGWDQPGDARHESIEGVDLAANARRLLRA
ncbi:MAG: amidohydrolase family protein, partial [Gammaproteobacteria bacterium]